MKKKLTTLMLVLMMCLLLPLAVHAEETTDDQITKTVDLTNYYYYDAGVKTINNFVPISIAP